ncbi:MAG: 16S rRNA (cytidine(1402)-2'-O)-methyltransferase [Hellea sp.]|nr:16S rRNA (cytidine(1402)-2'-O)-methyltransferase [Hellea sp.]
MTQNNTKSAAPYKQGETSKEENSVALQPGLYIVATPIGNIRDITLRALDALRSADLILAEDTRNSKKILIVYGINSSLLSYHEHNAEKRLPFVLKQLRSSKSVVLISDAGTPLISDPGFKLTRAALKNNIDVFPLPGASAVLAGLVKSGLPSDRFMFAGFLPSKSAARKTILQSFKLIDATLIFFETGPRVLSCLEDMRDELGDRDVALVRELTKKYEDGIYGTFSDLINNVNDAQPRGEIVLLAGPPKTKQMWNKEDVLSALKIQVPELGLKNASNEISEASGWTKRDVYQMGLSLK